MICAMAAMVWWQSGWPVLSSQLVSTDLLVFECLQLSWGAGLHVVLKLWWDPPDGCEYTR